MSIAIERGGPPVAASARDAAFTAYLQARQPALLRTAYLITGDRATAEDVLQTALAKLYLAWDRVERREAVDAYVRRIIVNEYRSLWRSPWRRREVAVDEVPETGAVTDRYDDGQAEALWSFVQTLPKKQRAVVVLRYYEELSEAEIADILGISVGTVKSQASRALAGLRHRVPSALRPEAAPQISHQTPDDRTPGSKEEDR